ncbi:unnamed protein product [Fraxinus pennsylvanica]|uniref:DNA2/NAM7 helicase helicase domain-containing protein n=1 Tax=Fraxinus pennsylvanica TaxID=56036 RepID=A0AAD1ZJZ8_9LAMI|nr:unnamed protein product [Fraxinus pennsylvanica]
MCNVCSQRVTQLNVATRSTVTSKLNKSQKEAIMETIRGVQCEHKTNVKLIWGPPGTGKMRTLSVTLLCLMQMNARTCAETNAAVPDLATQVVKLSRDSFKAEYKNGISSYPLGDILVSGNKDHTEMFSDIEEISLDYRVDKLAESLSPAAGWKHCITSMICFLEGCISQYRFYVDEVYKPESRSLLEFSRDRFRHTAWSLRRHMLTFFYHLRRNFIVNKIFNT